MFELTIKDQVYKFNFGVGFVREISKKKQAKNEDGTLVDIGLQYAVGCLMDEDPVEVIEILDLANKTESPRIKRRELDEYIQDEGTDLEELCRDILDFFERHNATKKKTLATYEFIELQKAKAEKEKAKMIAELNETE